MAKSTSSRSRRPHPHQAEPEPQERESKEIKSSPATAVAEASPPASAATSSAPASSGASGGGGEDVSAIDAETNAKYEQVKGGKLYIKDLQQMDILGLHEIARQENIQDYQRTYLTAPRPV